MNKEQVQLAVESGLELLGHQSDILIPARLNDGVFLLKQMLRLIATGELALLPTMQKQPGTPSEKKRVANRKKRAKKK